MTDIPSVVVLMSTYNGEKYLNDQIDSIISQKGNFRLSLIVRDDGSSDDTTEILNEYQKRQVLKWYQGSNIGPANSFMDLLYNCGNFDYYAFSDQDDVWNNDKIESGIETIKSIRRPCIYYCNAKLVDNKLNSLGTIKNKKGRSLSKLAYLCSGCVIGCSMLMNNELVNIVRSNSKPLAIDFHDKYLSRICVATDGIILYDPKPHFKYRQHGDNVVGAVPGSGSIRSFFDKVGHFLFHNDCVRSNTAKSLLEVYGSDAGSENRRLLRLLAEYRKDHDVKMELMSETVFKTGSKNDFLFKTLVFMEKV